MPTERDMEGGSRERSERERTSYVRNALVFDHFPCRPRRKKTIVCGELLNWTENPILAPFPPFSFLAADSLSFSLCLSFSLGLRAFIQEDGLCILIAHWQWH